MITIKSRCLRHLLVELIVTRPSSHQKKTWKFKNLNSVAAFFLLAMSLLSKPIKSMKTNVNAVDVVAMGPYLR